MKKCSYCGAEYQNDVVMCPVDQTSLDSPQPSSFSFMSRFIILFIRYVAAIFVSYVVSFAMFGLTVNMAGSLLPGHPDASDCALYVGIAVVGFSGVFLGTLCLERASRRVNSIIMLVWGLVYYVYLCYPMSMAVFGDTRHPLSLFFRWLLPLTVGALLAVALIFLIFRRQPAATVPQIFG